jgi:hypothetical protein
MWPSGAKRGEEGRRGNAKEKKIPKGPKNLNGQRNET